MAKSIEDLRAEYESLKAAERAAPSAAGKQAVQAAWAALEAAVPPRKPGRSTSWGNHSGKRQHAEQAARTAESMRRAALNRNR